MTKTIKSNSIRRRSGVAVVEFSLCLIFLAPLVLGTLVFGFRIIKDIQIQQVVRDLGHMYLRGTDFRNPAMVNIAKTLAQGLSLNATGKSGVVLSKVRLVTQVNCDAADPAHAGQNKKCTNRDQGAFMEQLRIGKVSIANSVFGTPPMDANFVVSDNNQSLASSARANGLMAILPLKAGEFAFIVEMINQTPELSIPGFSGRPQVYARAIF